jgi:hypothetical protein
MKTIEKALRLLLAEIVRLDLNRPSSDYDFSIEEVMMCFEMQDGVIEAKHMDGRPYVAQPLSRDMKVRAILKQAVREIGKLLHAEGLDLEEMQAVCGRVSSTDRRHGGRRGDIIDRAWNGIGHWRA